MWPSRCQVQIHEGGDRGRIADENQNHAQKVFLRRHSI